MCKSVAQFSQESDLHKLKVGFLLGSYRSKNGNIYKKSFTGKKFCKLIIISVCNMHKYELKSRKHLFS